MDIAVDVENERDVAAGRGIKMNVNMAMRTLNSFNLFYKWYLHEYDIWLSNKCCWLTIYYYKFITILDFGNQLSTNISELNTHHTNNTSPSKS